MKVADAPEGMARVLGAPRTAGRDSGLSLDQARIARAERACRRRYPRSTSLRSCSFPARSTSAGFPPLPALPYRASFITPPQSKPPEAGPRTGRAAPFGRPIGSQQTLATPPRQSSRHASPRKVDHTPRGGGGNLKSAPLDFRRRCVLYVIGGSRRGLYSLGLPGAHGNRRKTPGLSGRAGSVELRNHRLEHEKLSNGP